MQSVQTSHEQLSTRSGLSRCVENTASATRILKKSEGWRVAVRVEALAEASLRAVWRGHAGREAVWRGLRGYSAAWRGHAGETLASHGGFQERAAPAV